MFILVHLVVQRTGPTGAATKVRPVFDATRTGHNELLDGLPLTLPTIREILRDLQAGDFIAKADWTAGFHYIVKADGARPCTTFWCPVRREPTEPNAADRDTKM